MWVNIDATVNFQFGRLHPQIMKTPEGENVRNQHSKDKISYLEEQTEKRL